MDESPVVRLLRWWHSLRLLVGRPAYFHDRCIRRWHRWRWHRVSFPPEGPLVVLCPRGPYRVDPASWDLPLAEREIDPDGSYPPSYADLEGVHW